MSKLKMLVLGVAAAGALLGGIAIMPAGATALRTLILNVLTATTATITTLTATTGTITTLTAPTTTAATSFVGPSVSTETITAAATITANACGGLKRITAASDVTTNTTNTFTAPSTAGNCCMDVINVHTTSTIYLDSNALFLVTGAASLAIGPNGGIRVCSDGSYWRHAGWTEY